MLKLNASSVALGAALAVGAMLVMGQAGPQPQYVSWGPPKAGVVNIFQANSGPIPANGYVTLLTVPGDRWLTITSASTEGQFSLHFAELFAGHTTIKGWARSSTIEPFHADAAIGWTFRPGSEVVLVNGSGAMTNVQYSLTGYQTRD